MARTVEFAYDIESKVRVKPIEMDGFVDALCLDIRGEMYRVVYWNDGKRESSWMYGWEIEPAKNGKAT